MQQALEIINTALSEHPQAAIAFSGGGDSLVLLDLVYSRTPFRPLVLWANTGMEYPDTEPFIRSTLTRYDAALLVSQAPREPLEQWNTRGWPMLGKLAAVKWTQKHRDWDFKCSVSNCCRAMKIAPARILLKQNGVTCQLTGQRGQADDALRGLRAIKDGAINYVQADKMTVANPLTGWTDTMIRRYIDQNQLTEHPAKTRGAKTIGCMYCGGGAQFDNSGFKVLRQTQPEAWRRFIVDWRAGEIIMAIKHNVRRAVAAEALTQMGGLEAVAQDRPETFDYLRETPLRGYLR